MTRKIIAFFISFCLIFEQAGFAQVAPQLGVPAYLQNLTPVADKFRPVHLRSLSLDPATNSFDLLLDKGDAKQLQKPQIEETTKKLLVYFKIGLTLPNSMFWVNLRPDAPRDIIDPYLEKTDMGRVMLEADLQLKKDIARFTSPDTAEGRQYWDKVYKKAESLYSGLDMEIPTITRPWIVPGEIIIGESRDSAYIYKATFKVMLEQDYLKDAIYTFSDDRAKELNAYSSQIIRELIIPKLTREVNSSKRYAGLRQVYYSLILAQWFKKKYHGKPGTFASQIDTLELAGLTSKAAWSKDTYFKAYQKSFQNGEYNLQETAYTPAGETVRNYFSGGIVANAFSAATKASGAAVTAFSGKIPGGGEALIAVNVNGGTINIHQDGGTTQPGSTSDTAAVSGSKRDGETDAQLATAQENAAGRTLESVFADLKKATFKLTGDVRVNRYEIQVIKSGESWLDKPYINKEKNIVVKIAEKDAKSIFPLAHELAHRILEGHRLVDSRWLMFSQIGISIGAFLVSVPSIAYAIDRNIGLGIAFGAFVAMPLAAYAIGLPSRINEFKADYGGVLLMREAGYAINDGVTYLRGKLRARNPNESMADAIMRRAFIIVASALTMGLFSTGHPDAEARVNNLQAFTSWVQAHPEVSSAALVEKIQNMSIMDTVFLADRIDRVFAPLLASTKDQVKTEDLKAETPEQIKDLIDDAWDNKNVDAQDRLRAVKRADPSLFNTKIAVLRPEYQNRAEILLNDTVRYFLRKYMARADWKDKIAQRITMLTWIQRALEAGIALGGGSFIYWGLVMPVQTHSALITGIAMVGTSLYLFYLNSTGQGLDLSYEKDQFTHLNEFYHVELKMAEPELLDEFLFALEKDIRSGYYLDKFGPKMQKKVENRYQSLLKRLSKLNSEPGLENEKAAVDRYIHRLAFLYVERGAGPAETETSATQKDGGQHKVATLDVSRAERLVGMAGNLYRKIHDLRKAEITADRIVNDRFSDIGTAVGLTMGLPAALIRRILKNTKVETLKSSRQSSASNAGIQLTIDFSEENLKTGADVEAYKKRLVLTMAAEWGHRPHQVLLEALDKDMASGNKEAFDQIAQLILLVLLNDLNAADIQEVAMDAFIGMAFLEYAKEHKIAGNALTSKIDVSKLAAMTPDMLDKTLHAEEDDFINYLIRRAGDMGVFNDAILSELEYSARRDLYSSSHGRLSFKGQPTHMLGYYVIFRALFHELSGDDFEKRMTSAMMTPDKEWAASGIRERILEVGRKMGLALQHPEEIDLKSEDGFIKALSKIPRSKAVSLAGRIVEAAGNAINGMRFFFAMQRIKAIHGKDMSKISVAALETSSSDEDAIFRQEMGIMDRSSKNSKERQERRKQFLNTLRTMTTTLDPEKYAAIPETALFLPEQVVLKKNYRNEQTEELLNKLKEALLRELGETTKAPVRITTEANEREYFANIFYGQGFGGQVRAVAANIGWAVRSIPGLGRMGEKLLAFAYSGYRYKQYISSGSVFSNDLAAALKDAGNFDFGTIAAVQTVGGKTAVFSPEAWKAREEMLDYSGKHSVETLTFGLGEIKDGILWIKEMVQPDRIIEIQDDGHNTIDFRAIPAILIFDTLLKQAIIYSNFSNVGGNDFYMQRTRDYAAQKGLQVLYHMHSHILDNRIPTYEINRNLSPFDVSYILKLRDEEHSKAWNGEGLFLHENAVQWDELVLIDKEGNKALFSDLPVEQGTYRDRAHILENNFETWFDENSGQILLGSAADAWVEDQLTQRMKLAAAINNSDVLQKDGGIKLEIVDPGDLGGKKEILSGDGTLTLVPANKDNVPIKSDGFVTCTGMCVLAEKDSTLYYGLVHLYRETQDPGLARVFELWGAVPTEPSLERDITAVQERLRKAGFENIRLIVRYDKNSYDPVNEEELAGRMKNVQFSERDRSEEDIQRVISEAINVNGESVKIYKTDNDGVLGSSPVKILSWADAGNKPNKKSLTDLINESKIYDFGPKEIEDLRNKSRGFMTMEEYVVRFSTDVAKRNGYVLSRSHLLLKSAEDATYRRVAFNFFKIFGCVNYDVGYIEQGLVKSQYESLLPQTEEYMNRILNSGQPIVFFVPEYNESMGGWGEAKNEIGWLVANRDNPLVKENVFFVFGINDWVNDAAQNGKIPDVDQVVEIMQNRVSDMLLQNGIEDTLKQDLARTKQRAEVARLRAPGEAESLAKPILRNILMERYRKPDQDWPIPQEDDVIIDRGELRWRQSAIEMVDNEDISDPEIRALIGIEREALVRDARKQAQEMIDKIIASRLAEAAAKTGSQKDGGILVPKRQTPVKYDGPIEVSLVVREKVPEDYKDKTPTVVLTLYKYSDIPDTLPLKAKLPPGTDYILVQNDTTRYIELRDKTTVSIGRNTPGPFILPQPVSRDHLTIGRVGDAFFFEDQESSFGTRVETKPVVEENIGNAQGTIAINGDGTQIAIDLTEIKAFDTGRAEMGELVIPLEGLEKNIYAGKEANREILDTDLSRQDNTQFVALVSQARTIGAQTGLTEEQKARQIYDLVRRAFARSIGSPANQDKAVQRTNEIAQQYAGQKTGFDIFLNEQIGVCRHHAVLFSILARSAGLQSSAVRGTAWSGRHLWVELFLRDGRTFLVDPFNGIFIPGHERAARELRWEETMVFPGTLLGNFIVAIERRDNVQSLVIRPGPGSAVSEGPLNGTIAVKPGRLTGDALGKTFRVIDGAAYQKDGGDLKTIWTNLPVARKKELADIMDNILHGAIENHNHLVIEVQSTKKKVSIELQFEGSKVTMIDIDGTTKTFDLEGGQKSGRYLGAIHLKARVTKEYDNTLMDAPLKQMLASKFTQAFDDEQLYIDEEFLGNISLEEAIVFTRDPATGQYDMIRVPVKRGITFTFDDSGNLYKYPWIESLNHPQANVIGVISEGHFHPQEEGSEVLSLYDIKVMVSRARNLGMVMPETVVTAEDVIAQDRLIVEAALPRIRKQLVLTKYTFDYNELEAIENSLKKMGQVPDEELREEILEKFISFERTETKMDVTLPGTDYMNKDKKIDPFKRIFVALRGQADDFELTRSLRSSLIRIKNSWKSQDAFFRSKESDYFRGLLERTKKDHPDAFHEISQALLQYARDRDNLNEQASQEVARLLKYVDSQKQVHGNLDGGDETTNQLLEELTSDMSGVIKGTLLKIAGMLAELDTISANLYNDALRQKDQMASLGILRLLERLKEPRFNDFTQEKIEKQFKAATSNATVSVNSLVAAEVELVRKSLEDRGITVNFKGVSEDKRIQTYPWFLDYVSKNILTNAGKLSEPNTAITITVEYIEKGDQYKITIEDQGPGMPAEYLARMHNKNDVSTLPTAGKDATTSSTGVGMPKIFEYMYEPLNGQITVTSTWKDEAGQLQTAVRTGSPDSPNVTEISPAHSSTGTKFELYVPAVNNTRLEEKYVNGIAFEILQNVRHDIVNKIIVFGQTWELIQLKLNGKIEWAGYKEKVDRASEKFDGVMKTLEDTKTIEISLKGGAAPDRGDTAAKKDGGNFVKEAQYIKRQGRMTAELVIADPVTGKELTRAEVNRRYLRLVPAMSIVRVIIAEPTQKEKETIVLDNMKQILEESIKVGASLRRQEKIDVRGILNSDARGLNALISATIVILGGNKGGQFVNQIIKSVDENGKIEFHAQPIDMSANINELFNIRFVNKANLRRFETLFMQVVKYVKPNIKYSRQIQTGLDNFDGGKTTENKPEAINPAAATGKGGIDLRALPIVTKPIETLAAPAGLKTPIAVDSKVAEALNRQWLDIQQQMQQGPMPYKQMKEFVASCNKQQAVEQIDQVFACIANILRLEEDAAVATPAELKEILTSIG